MSRGKGWEALLRQVHARYRREGRAVVDKTDPPIVRLRDLKRGAFAAKFSGTGPVDYFGCLPGGRMVAFDAKDCKGKRWGLDGLHKHQARCLDAYAGVGALCFVALRAWGGGWVLPWEHLGPMWWRWERGEASRGEMSVSPKWPALVPMRTVEIMVGEQAFPVQADWLSALEVEHGDEQG